MVHWCCKWKWCLVLEYEMMFRTMVSTYVLIEHRGLARRCTAAACGLHGSSVRSSRRQSITTVSNSVYCMCLRGICFVHAVAANDHFFIFVGSVSRLVCVLRLAFRTSFLILKNYKITKRAFYSFRFTRYARLVEVESKAVWSRVSYTASSGRIIILMWPNEVVLGKCGYWPRLLWVIASWFVVVLRDRSVGNVRCCGATGRA